MDGVRGKEKGSCGYNGLGLDDGKEAVRQVRENSSVLGRRLEIMHKGGIPGREGCFWRG